MKKQTQKTENTMTFQQVMIDAIKAEQVVETGKAKKSIVSQELMELAAQFVTGKKFNVGAAPNGLKEFRSEVPSGFLGACYEAEQWAKSDAAGVNKVEKIPTCWSTAKSNIKAAFVDFGLLVTDYDTESALRKDLNEKRKARASEETPEGMPEATADNNDLLRMFHVLQGQYSGLNDENRTAMLDDLEGIFSHYAAILEQLVPKKPTKAEADTKQQATITAH